MEPFSMLWRALEMKSRVRVLTAACIVTLIAFLAVQVHVQVNYPPDLRDLVRTKASLVTIVITFPISVLVGYQMLLNWRLSEELRHLVKRDRLTNLATRDFFFARLSANPEGFGVSLMIDIDHFKTINDTYGHLIGDRVIAHVAGLLSATVRSSDIVCRFGGEEFVVFLESADATLAFDIAERIRLNVLNSPLPDVDIDVSVTVSIGASLAHITADIDAAIQAADQALYKAKSMGRNQTVTFSSDEDVDFPSRRRAARR